MPQVGNIADWRGKQVVDRDGDKVGSLVDVYYDAETDEPQFGTVKEGLVRKHIVFVPLAGVTTSPDKVQIAVSKDFVKDGPKVETDAEVTAEVEQALYRHYDLPYSKPATPAGRRLARR